jgi:hypothetical protein
MPHSIVSNRDPTFTNIFWQELFKLQGTQLHLSTTYHPRTDGQTEVVNKFFQTYLRCFASERQNKWVQWLLLVEWWYNTLCHIVMRMTPFEVVYGKNPPLVLSYFPCARSSRWLNKHLPFEKLFFVPSKRIWSWPRIA